MEIKATNTAPLNNKSVLKLQDLLIKFEHRLFIAIISNKVDNRTFVVNSKLGSFQISSNLDLQTADKLTLKIKPSGSSTPASLDVIKIERPAISQQLTDKVKLNDTKLNAVALDKLVFKVIISQKEALNQIPKLQNHFIAKIIAQDKSSLHLQDLKGQLFSLDKKLFAKAAPALNNDQHLVIKWLQSNKVEIQSISNENLLLQAQRQLLPKFPQSQQTHQRLATAAFKLFQSIDNEPVQIKKQLMSEQSVQKNQPTLISSRLQVTSENTSKAIFQKDNGADTKTALPTSEALKTLKFEPVSMLNKPVPVVLQKIKNDLQQLLRSQPISVKTLSPENIQKLLISLNVIDKPQTKGISPISFTQKLSTINQSIEKLLNEIDANVSKNKTNKEDTELLSEFLKLSLKDSKQAFESTINKLMFQNTASKLNQEVNLTQLINTQIPFESDKDTKDIHLTIKQRKKAKENEDDCWEIQLSLEMGLLGVINTTIILRDSFEVSVLFWAELASTKQLIDDKKNIFYQQMKNAGFNVENISVFLGKKSNDRLPIEISNKRLIDINV